MPWGSTVRPVNPMVKSHPIRIDHREYASPVPNRFADRVVAFGCSFILQPKLIPGPAYKDSANPDQRRSIVICRDVGSHIVVTAFFQSS